MFGRKSQPHEYPDDIFDSSRMSFGDHLDELRTRMLRALYALIFCLFIGFILDATLGMISMEQNQIIKLFSVMAVILLPPTLVASVYGMNFKHMPELDWTLGYPWALGLMVLAAVGPVIYFRRKGWF